MVYAMLQSKAAAIMAAQDIFSVKKKEREEAAAARCRHPPDKVKRRGNQYAKWRVCVLCDTRLAYEKRSSKEAAAKNSENKGQKPDQEENQSTVTDDRMGRLENALIKLTNAISSSQADMKIFVERVTDAVENDWKMVDRPLDLKLTVAACAVEA